MDILFIGGSNLVIKDGFVSYLKNYLCDIAGIDDINITNISIPGTMSMFGLSNLDQEVPQREYDHICIEYAINDYGLYKRNPKLWEIIFDLLLGKLNARFPGAKKTVILLGRRNWKFRELQEAINISMEKIADANSAFSLNIDKIMTSEIFSGIKFWDLYMDGAHYKPPVITNYISSMVALHIVSKQNSLSKNKSKPNRISLGSYDFVEEAKQQRFSQGSIVQFKGSRFKTEALEVTANHSIELSVPGLPCGISFVAAENVASVLIDVNGEKSILQMLHRGSPPMGKYRFLIRHNPFYWIDVSGKSRKIPSSSKIKLRIIDKSDSEWDDMLVRESYAMVDSEPDNPNARVYLKSIDYLETA